MGTAGAAAVVKLIEHFCALKRLAMPWTLATRPEGALAKGGVSGLTGANLGFSFEPTLMMYGVGMLVGPRVGVSLFLGSVVAWLWLAPMALNNGWVPPGKVGAYELWYVAGLKWLLWPGVSLMVFSALTSFAFSWRSVLAAFSPNKTLAEGAAKDEVIMPRRYFMLALLVATLLSVTLQVLYFNIAAWVATLGVLMTFALALVATRVSGEANITPVGAMGKVTQLVFAVLAPAQPAANLMSACVTGGAASQCAVMRIVSGG